MLIPRLLVAMLLVGTTVSDMRLAFGQNYPHKPLRILAGEVGGSSDVTARLIAQGLSANMGQQVIVDNRGSGSGDMAAQITAKAPPDGYTMLISGNSIWLLPFLRSNVSLDVVKDFAPITAATSSPVIVVVNPALPVKSVKELVALAKSKPGQLNYGSGPTGTASHLTAELFKSMADVNIVRVPYKGSGPAIIDLIAGQVQLVFSPAASVMAHIKSGKLRALAVTSARPSALLPDLPAVAAAVPGYESVQLLGFFAPARTPAPLVNRLNQEIVRVLNRTDVKERFLSMGTETVGNSPQEFAAMRDADMTRLGKLIKDAGIREE